MDKYIVRDSMGTYNLKKATKEDILQLASDIIYSAIKTIDCFTQPEQARRFVQMRLSCKDAEQFCCLFLDAKNRPIEFKTLFYGTIDSSSVHPREVVKAGLKCNAAGVIVAHNHPSGTMRPSEADIIITKALKEILSVVGIRLLDHILIGDTALSFAERGLL